MALEAEDNNCNQKIQKKKPTTKCKGGFEKLHLHKIGHNKISKFLASHGQKKKDCEKGKKIKKKEKNSEN